MLCHRSIIYLHLKWTLQILPKNVHLVQHCLPSRLLSRLSSRTSCLLDVFTLSRLGKLLFKFRAHNIKLPGFLLNVIKKKKKKNEEEEEKKTLIMLIVSSGYEKTI